MHVYVCGGTAGSELIRQLLQAELMVECKAWNPASFIEHAMPPQQLADFENVASQLTVAIGAAVATF